MSEATTLYLLLYLRLFVITQVVEMPIYWLALARRPAPVGEAALSERPTWQRLAIAFGASAITHPPFVILLHPHLLALGPTGALVVGELLVVAVEGLWLRWFEVEQPWMWALTANAASVAVGMTINMVMHA